MTELSKYREELAEVLAGHRVNYHHQNVGPEPVTADNLRYTSCEGCDWLGGHRDEAGWESHLADALLPVLARVVAEAKGEALREAADKVQKVYDMQCPPMPVDRYMDRGAHAAHQWWTTVLGATLRDLRAEASGREGGQDA